MDPREQFEQVSEILTGLVDETRSDQLALATPCSDFTVRDLIGHFTLGRFLFAAGFAGDADRSAELIASMPQHLGDVLGSDHHATYHEATAAINSAAAGVGDLESTVSLIFGEMPAGYALQLLSSDNLVHCWDLACATGQDFNPAGELVDLTAEFFSSFISEDARAGGMFGPEVEVAGDASSLDKMLAFCGRQP